MAYPNGIFSAFSFIGFLFCLIPLYWHLEGIFVRRRPCPLVGIHKLIDCSRVSLFSLECGHHVIYGLGWPGLFKRIHQFGRLEQQHGKCGPGLV
jgi:hypothetical protein